MSEMRRDGFPDPSPRGGCLLSVTRNRFGPELFSFTVITPASLADESVFEDDFPRHGGHRLKRPHHVLEECAK